MLYLAPLGHSPDKCPGVALDIRERVAGMASTTTDESSFVTGSELVIDGGFTAQ